MTDPGPTEEGRGQHVGPGKPSSDSPARDAAIQDAAAAYARFLRLRGEGVELRFEEFCDQRPEMANALRILHSLHAEPVESTSCESFEALVHENLASRIGLTESGPTELAPGGRAEVPSIPERATGRYVVRREVARGGMGIIFSAWDSELKRPLAMKVMQGRDGSPSNASGLGPHLLARFLHEAQVTGQLDHPGIVPVHDLGIDGEGRIFFTMRLVEGSDLRTVFERARQRREGWTPTRVVGVLVKVCEALAYAHSKGVIHRDLKPANIMVGRFGETYVMDWGLAKIVGEDDHHDLRFSRAAGDADGDEREMDSTPSPIVTMDGTVLGTPAYMPPEQASGCVDELGERSDIYSVGAMLYTLLSGRIPYTEPGSTPSPVELVDAVVRNPPTPILQIHEDARPELVAICDKAMARSKADRYASMMELAEDLQAYLENRVVRAYRTGALAELQKWVVRNRGMAASIAVAFVLGLAGLLVFIFVQDAAKRDLASERDAKSEALVAKEAALAEKDRVLGEKETALEERQRALVRADGLRIIGNSSIVLPDDPGLALLLGIEGARREPGVLANNALLAALAAIREERTLFGHTDQLKVAHFAPDGQHVVSCSRDGKVRLYDAASGHEVLRFVGHLTQVNAVAFSPNGRRIVSASWDKTVRLWNAATGREIGRGKHGYVVDFVTFSSDGRLIVSCSRDRTARVWDAVACRPLVVLQGHTGQVAHASFSPDVQTIVTGSHDGTARIWRVATGEQLAVLEGHEGWVNAVAFDDGGKLVLSASADGTARVWSASSTKPPIVLEGHEGAVHTVEWSPDGRRILTASSDRSARLWDPATGAQLGVLDGHTDLVYEARFSPEGDRIVTASRDRTARIWDADTGLELASLRGHDGWVRSARFSPDGARVVTASNDRTARIWKASAERGLAALQRRFEWSGSAAVDVARRKVVIYARGPEAEIRDAVTGRLVASLEGHGSWIDSARFSEDGTRVATASRDKTARIWDAATGRELLVLEGHLHWVSDASFSADGQRVVTASHDYTARVWDVSSGKLESTLEGHPAWVDAAFFSPDGARVVTVSDDRTARLWRASTGEHLLTLSGHADWVHGATFSGDGRWVVTASYDRTTRIWDSLTGHQLVALSGHEGEFTGATFSPDRKLIATLYRDGTARVWRFPGGEPVATVEAGPTEFVSATFSDDGGSLATVFMDLTTRSWPLSPLLVAPSRAPRMLTPDEVDRWEIGDLEERKKYRVEWRMGFSQRSLSIAERLSKRSPDDRQARLRYFEQFTIHAARLTHWAKDLDAALALLERAARESQERHPRILFALAESHRLRGSHRKAVLTMEKCVSLPGFDPAVEPKLEDARKLLLPDLVSYDSIDAALSRLDRIPLVPRGATWRWSPGKTEPSPGLEWTDVEFDDSSWASGQSGFGSGSIDAATRLEDMRGTYTNLYVRHRFSLEDPGSWKRLLLSVRADDGFVAYLNSKEIGRANAGPTGERVPYDGGARARAAKPFEPIRIWIEPGALRRGENILVLQGLRLEADTDFSLHPVLTAEAFSDAMRDDAVLSAFREVADGEDDRLRLLYFEGLTRARQGRHQEAIERFSKIVGAGATSPLPLCRLIESLRASGDEAAADARLKELLDRPFDSPDNDSQELKDAAWAVVQEPGRRPDEYYRALKWAGQAVRASPMSRSLRSVLGFAQYRMELYEKALGVVLMTRKFGRKGDDRRPRELACLAMAHAKLGQRQQAVDALAELRDVVLTDGWSSKPEVQAVLREAEVVCVGGSSE